jgi:hypothetical protein
MINVGYHVNLFEIKISRRGWGLGGVFLYEQKDLKVYSVHH